jgi:hypothetical protein
LYSRGKKYAVVEEVQEDASAHNENRTFLWLEERKS